MMTALPSLDPIFRTIMRLIIAGIGLTIFMTIDGRVLNHVYFEGQLQDGYWLSGAIWRNGFELTNPPWFHTDVLWTFYLVHFAPILQIGNVLSYLYAHDPITNIAKFTALVFLTVYLCTTYSAFAAVQPERSRVGLLLALLSVPILLTGVIITNVLHSHWEYLIPAFVMLTIVAAAQRRTALAWMGLIFCLTTREDAGLHLASWLVPLLAVDRLSGRPWRTMRLPLVFVAIGIAYSVIVMVSLRVFFEPDNLFQRSYPGLGVPYEHLSWDFLVERVSYYFTHREYIVVPPLLLGVLALLRRDLYLACGVVAFIPWFVLHVTAVNFVAGTMAWYYGFPLLVLFAWPLIVVAWRRGAEAQGIAPVTPHRPWLHVAMFLLLTAAGCFTANPQIGYGQRSAFLPFNVFDDARHRALKPDDTIRVVRALRPFFVPSGDTRLGTILANNGIDGLLPDAAHRRTALGEPGYGTPYKTADTVILLGYGFGCPILDNVLRFNGIDRFYHFPGTNVFLLSRLDAAEVLGLQVPIRQIRMIAEARGITTPPCNLWGGWTPRA